MKRGDVTTESTEIQWIIKDYYKQLYAKKLDNLKEMHKLLETYNLPKLNHEEMKNLKRPITRKEIEFSNQKPLNKENSRTRWLHR